MGWESNEARMGDRKSASRVLAGKPDRRKSPGETSAWIGGEKNIEMDVK